MKNILFISLFLLSAVPVISQYDVNRADMAHYLQPGSELSFQYTLLSDGRFMFSYEYPALSVLEVELAGYDEKSLKKPATLNLLKSFCSDLDCRIILNSDTLNQELTYFIVVSDITIDDKFFIPISFSEIPLTGIMLTNAFDEWVPGRYLTTNSEIYVRNLNEEEELELSIFALPFAIADPPSGIRPIDKKGIKPEVVIPIDQTQALFLEHAGLYRIYPKDRPEEGISFRVEQAPYPQYNRLEDLANAMVYLTTQDEQKSLMSNEINKASFDKIWLEMAGTEENARAAIRFYFRGISISNQLFTTYKEGWRTDKGMIYTIFGAPDHVLLSKGNEVWEYEKTNNHEELSFTFSAMPTIFSQYHSILQREQKYAFSWNRTVDRLRRGTPNHE